MDKPVRINKYLADHKFSTRRGADELIKAGKVKINGKTALLGSRVDPADVVEVDKKAVAAREKAYVYFAYNKPVGIVTHSAPSFAEAPAGKQKVIKAIADVIDLKGVSPIGRLDKDSHGLILLTNDGRVTERLLSPNFDHEKEYVVKVSRPLKQNMLTRISKGIKLEDGYITKPAEVFWDGDLAFRIVLTEGKKHQIRRMVTAVGNEVKDLARVRIMDIELGDLKIGTYRRIIGKELKSFLASIGL